MEWMLGIMAACVVFALIWRNTGPHVPVEQVAEGDLGLVREADRARWRRQRLRVYRIWKRQDDFYRIAAFRKKIKGGMPEPEARALVRKEFPFYYLAPASRDIEGYEGDDAALPIVLRPRIERGSRLIKALMEEKGASFRTMNALIRECLRKGIL